MTFREATDLLLSYGFSAEALGDAAGVSANTILRARRSTGQVRPPPRGWQAAFRVLLEQRGTAFFSLASELADA